MKIPSSILASLNAGSLTLLVLISSCSQPAKVVDLDLVLPLGAGDSSWVFQNQDGNVNAIRMHAIPADVRPVEVSIAIESGIVSRKKILFGASNFGFVCVVAANNVLVSSDKINFANHIHTSERSIYVYSRVEGTAALNYSINRCINENEKDSSFSDRDNSR